jgi:hypothetical protein
MMGLCKEALAVLLRHEIFWHGTRSSIGFSKGLSTEESVVQQLLDSMVRTARSFILLIKNMATQIII